MKTANDTDTAPRAMTLTPAEPAPRPLLTVDAAAAALAAAHIANVEACSVADRARKVADAAEEVARASSDAVRVADLDLSHAVHAIAGVRYDRETHRMVKA